MTPYDYVALPINRVLDMITLTLQLRTIFMDPASLINVGIFLAGIVVHFLYNRYAVSGSTSTPSAADASTVAAPAASGNSAPTNGILANIVHRLLDAFAPVVPAAAPAQPTPAVPTDTETALLALVNKLLNQQAPTAVAATAAPASQASQKGP
jgi:hypothetical protein